MLHVTTAGRSLGAVATTTVTADVLMVLRDAPPILQDVAGYVQEAASLAPTVTPVLKQLLPLLTAGPQLAPLVQYINADAAKLLKSAPQYAPLVQQVITVLGKATALAPKIEATLRSIAATATSIDSDPDLALFADRLNLLIEIYRQKSGGGLSGAAAPVPGVGLKKIIPWLNRGIFVAQNPWVVVAVPAVILGVAGAIGFALGRAGR